MNSHAKGNRYLQKVGEKVNSHAKGKGYLQKVSQKVNSHAKGKGETFKRQVNRADDPHKKGRGNFVIGTKTSLCSSGTTTRMNFSKYGYHLGLVKPTSGV